MQILQWLFKIADDPNQSQSETQKNQSFTAKKIGGDKINKSTHEPNRDIRRKRRKRKGKIAEQTEIICKNLNLFKILKRKDIAKACFYSTLNLNRPENYQRNQYLHTMKLKKEDLARGLSVISSSHQNKADNNNNSHVGKKVLPINMSDQTSSSSSSSTKNENDDQCRKKSTGKIKGGGDKTRTISRMKELLRWAAAAKSSSHHKGPKYLSRKVLQFRNKSSLKSVPDDDQLSNDSPKISFRWDLESCSTISSSYSAISMASSSSNIHDQTIISLPSVSSTPLHNLDFHHHSVTRPGNWITTDSEFVVLEL